MTPATIDRTPTAASSSIAAVAALVALGVAGRHAWLAVGLGAVGVVVLLAGLWIGRRGAVTVGAATLLGGVLVAGVAGAPPTDLLVAAVAPVVAYDAGTRAVALGAQLGREAPTRRLELLHAGATAVVGALVATVGVSVFRTGVAGLPVAALVALLLAAVLVASALR